ncbi:hypothetical protein [Butyrivibrio sp. AC2005]|uniref:hypothetical protein n=1 Tax=Butyrivibrio sp. AC2005 TaxID=1280672 RepID=UPI0003F4DEFF|nr:hypothetical protein [Butyrivibrio sp. AC2005]
MSQITCNCGSIYDSSFKFCPECAAPNPEYANKPSADAQSPRPMKKKFTKVGESSLNKSTSEQEPPASKAPSTAAPSSMQRKVTPKKNYTIVRQNPVVSATPIQHKPVQQNPMPESNELFEEYENDEDDVSAFQDAEIYEDYDYEDDETTLAETAPVDYDDDEDYEDEHEDTAEEVPSPVQSAPLLRRKGKVLAAPTIKGERNISNKTITPMPKTKRIAQTKSSLGKGKPDYDPNHDGYYDDRLPAILDEVTKTSHMDVILKISLSAVCIAGLITYCIFYVQI